MKTFEAVTVEDAVQKAVATLNVKSDQLAINVVQTPRRGFLGLGQRQAKIEVTIKAPVKKAPVTPTKVTPKDVTTTDDLPKKADLEEPDAAELTRRHQANVAKMQQAANKLVDYLVDVLAAMGVKAQPKIEQLKAHELVIDLKVADTAKVIGYHGRRLNALEQIGQAFLTYQGVSDPGLVLDVANYRQKRQIALEKLANRCVTEVIATNQAVFLDPMPARERKYLHKLLEKQPRVKTYSHGRDPYRSLVVAPQH